MQENNKHNFGPEILDSELCRPRYSLCSEVKVAHGNAALFRSAPTCYSLRFHLLGTVPGSAPGVAADSLRWFDTLDLDAGSRWGSGFVALVYWLLSQLLNLRELRYDLAVWPTEIRYCVSAVARGAGVATHAI